MSPVTQKSDSVSLLYIRATPSASTNRLGDIAQPSEAQAYLKVYVTAPPENGVANKAIIKLLSKKLDAPKSSFTLIRGQTERYKIFEVSMNIETLTTSLKLAMGSLF